MRIATVILGTFGLTLGASVFGQQPEVTQVPMTKSYDMPLPTVTPTPMTAQPLPLTYESAPVVGAPIPYMPRMTGLNDSFIWIQTDFLMAWMTSHKLNIPLVTSGSPGDAVPGAIGQPNTQVLIGNQKVDQGVFTGFSGRIGIWSGPSDGTGYELGFFWMPQKRTELIATSDQLGNPLLALPFFRTDGTRGESSRIISTPIVPINGNVRVDLASTLWGLEFNYLVNFARRGNFTGSYIFGLRNINLREKLEIVSTTSNQAAGRLSVFDDFFYSSSSFLGLQFGAKFGWGDEILAFDIIPKVSFGSTRSLGTITGKTREIGNGVPSAGTFPGGVFALPTNSIEQSTKDFTIVPELNMMGRWQATSRLSLTLGYQFMAWGNLVRASEMPNHYISANQFIANGGGTDGATNPVMQLKYSTIYVNGITFGFQFGY